MSPPAVRTHPVRFTNVTAPQPDELRDMCDIWLDTICAAGWSSKEAQRVAAYLTTCIYGNRTGELYLRDLESNLNIQSEESQRALKQLKLFGVLEEFQIERGKITVDARMTSVQKVRLAEMRAKLAELETASTERAMNEGIAALRSVARGSSQPTANKFDNDAIDAAIGG